MLASVIIPTYKRPQLLLRCLKALHEQNIKKSFFEVIVVSDGFDEETKKAIEQQKLTLNTGLEISFLHTKGKKGPAAARNLGWQNARAPYILFTDDDCVPATAWVASYIAAFKKHETYKIAFTGKIVVPLPPKPTDFEKNTAHLENVDFVTANCATTFTALEAVGGFDETFTMAWREDSDLHFSLIKNNIAIKRIENAMVVHPVRKASWGVSLKEQKKCMFNFLLLKKHPRLYKELISAGPPPNYYFMAGFFLLGLLFLFTGTQGAAITFFALWGILVISFTAKRLSGTSLSPAHVSEMLVTSAIIPFYSIYWSAFGFLKYKAAKES